jgi:plastocyanin
MRLVISLLLATLCLSAQAPDMQSLGTVRGLVGLTRSLSLPERRPGVAEFATPPPRDLPETRRAVVYLNGATTDASRLTREPSRARMDQRGETFVPHVLAVAAGTVVDFPNNDATYHSVFSLSKPKRFDLGRYAQGRSKAVRFDRPGVVRIFCDIHSHMSAFILVFNHNYFDTTDSLGRYQIEDVPPGTYSVVAWHEGETRLGRTVTIPAEGGIVEVNFPVQ